MIKGITDSIRPRLPLIGTFWKGLPKIDGKINPEKIDYFRFEAANPNDKALIEAIRLEIGEKPKQIEFALPFPSKNLCWETFRQKFSASEGCIHLCDGQNAFMELGEDAEYHFWDFGEGPPCRFSNLDRGDRCTPMGFLYGFLDLPAFPGLIRFAISSISDIRAIESVLLGLESGGFRIAGIPARIAKVPRDRGFPSQDKDGKPIRRRTLKYPIDLQILRYEKIESQIRRSLPEGEESQIKKEEIFISQEEFQQLKDIALMRQINLSKILAEDFGIQQGRLLKKKDLKQIQDRILLGGGDHHEG
jgi:hypothetical protein